VYKMFFLGGNFVSRLIWTLKSKKTLKNLFKNLKTFSKNPRFFLALVHMLGWLFSFVCGKLHVALWLHMVMQ